MPVKITTLLLTCIFAVLASGYAVSQDLPNTIRGYKLNKTRLDVALRTAGEPVPQIKHDLLVTLDKPAFAGMGLSGARLAVTGEIATFLHEGEVDLIMFREFTVNGVAVDIDEYSTKFRLEKSKPFKMMEPVFVNAGIMTLAKAAAKRVDANDSWHIGGTVLVFGKFKRMGFRFKRVIPVKVNAVIRNPLMD